MPKQESRRIEKRVSYTVGHRVRIEVLTTLHEGSFSAIELARIVRQPLSTVTHHVEELLRDGSIEISHTEKVRSIEQNFYRGIRPAYYSDEEMQALPFEKRQELYGVVLEGTMSEALASLWAGKISNDPRTFLAWCWFNVDSVGRAEIADELQETWDRVEQIERRSMERVAKTGEETTSIIVSSFGYERARNTPHPPQGRHG